MDPQSRSAQRQAELQALEAMIANMEGDENEVFDQNQKIQVDPDLAQIQKQANQFLSHHGEKPVQYNNNKSYKPKATSQQEYQQALQGNTSAQERRKNIADLERMIGDISSDEDASDPVPRGAKKVQMDPEMQAIMKQCNQLSSQFGIDIPEPQQPQINARPAQQIQAAPPSGNQLIDQDNHYSNIVKIVSIEALLLERDTYEKRFLQHKSPQMQSHGKAQIKLIDDFLKGLAKKVQEGKLDAEKYRVIIKQTFLGQQDLFKEADSEGNKLFKNRLMVRCGTIQGEYKAVNKDEDGHFQNVIKKLPKIAGMPNNLTYEIDQKDYKEKIRTLAERNIHYLNFYKYLKNTGLRDHQAGQIFELLTTRFKVLMTQLKEGEEAKIGQFLDEEAPKITPSIFHGMPEQTYKAKIKQFHQLFHNCLELEQQYKKMIQNQRSAQKQAEECAHRIEQYQLEMYELEEMGDFKKMIHFPVIREDLEQRNIRVSNLSIEKYTVKIVFKRLLNAKPDKYKLQWSIDINNKVFSDATEWCDKSMVFGYEKQLVTGDRKNPYNDLHKKKISISMYSKGVFSNSAAGNGVLDLSDLETNSSYEGSVNIMHKNKNYQLEFGVYIREPIASSTFQSGKSKTVKIEKRFGKFNMEDGVDQYIEKCLSTAQPPKKKVVQQEPPKKQQQQQQKQAETQQVKIQPQQQQQQQEQQQLPNISLPVLEHDDSHPDTQVLKQFSQIPKGLTQDNIVNPENPSMCHCLTYLKLYQKDVEQGAVQFGNEKKRAERRLARDLNDRLMGMQVKLEKAMQNGDIELEDYVDGLKELLQRDQLLLKVYQNIPQLKQDWTGFVQKRIQVIQHELKDCPQGDGNDSNQQQQQPQQQQEQQSQKPNLPKLIVLEHEESHPDIQFLSQIDASQLEKGLNKQIIVNPEDPVQNNCFLYCEEFQKELEEAAIRFGQEKKRGERRLARALNDQCMSVQTKLKKAMEQGDIDQEDYLDNLKEILERDEKLIKFYQSVQGNLKQDWVGFVKARKQVVEFEVKSVPQ